MTTARSLDAAPDCPPEDDSDPRATLLGYPLRLWDRHERHLGDLLAELELVLIGQQVGCHAPARLVELAADLTTRYGAVLAAVSADRELALSRGDATMDLVVPLEPDTPAVLTAALAAASEVDELCRTGRMLVLPTPADLVAFRTWWVQQVLAQAEGRLPTPWIGPLD